MTVRCPGCGKEYPAPVLVPGKSATVRCRACGSMFRVGRSVPSPAPAPPPARQPAPSPRPDPPRAAAAFDESVFEPVAGDSPFEPLPEAPEHPPAGDPRHPLPPFEEEASPAAEPQPVPAPTGAPVLIADEARPFREQLVQALHEMGVRCAVVEDGESALRYVQENHPQLMLVNVYLRRLLGIIVCERVKADPLLRSTRVVLIGALFRKDRFVREPGRLYGADDYIEEAVGREELRERLSALLGGASASSPAAGGAPEIAEDLQRLIRIILSDIALYYPERCEAAVREGRFQEEFRVEIEEGRRLILDRFPGSRKAVDIYARAVNEWAQERQRALVS